MRNVGTKIVGIVIVTAVLAAATTLYISLYLTHSPTPVSARTLPSGGQLTLATVPAAGPAVGNPDWVSYFAVDPDGTHWRHSTIYKVPAHSLVHIRIYQYDGASGLRNPFLSQAQGVVGDTFRLNGKPTKVINPDDASHIFAVPQLGISVPLPGVSATAKNPCAAAPCTLAEDHETIDFTIRTGKAGRFRWQCFVPCAAGWIAGWGGPMQTIGYMDGFLDVV